MIMSLLDQALIALPLLIGSYITISLLKLPDFSIESAYLFGAVMAFCAKDLPLPLVLSSALFGGMIVGMVVSMLSQCLKLPFLLAAIIVNGIFHGLTQYILGTSLKSFQKELVISEHAFFAIIGGIIISTMIFLLRSEMGYSLAIYGNNPLFFTHHNISGRSIAFFGVIMGHGFAGIAGFLFAMSNGLVDLTMSYGVVLLCLTALILGKSIIRSCHPTILVPLIGLAIYLLVQQLLLHFGLNLKYFNSFQALFVLGILCLSRKKKVSLDHMGV